jgi:hypothetical protein
MIAEYLTRRDAEIYASELTQLYGPDVHFDVVGMPDPVFGDTVWYVLGTGTVDGEMFAQYAQEGKQWHKAAAVMEKPVLPAGSKGETDSGHSCRSKTFYSSLSPNGRRSPGQFRKLQY